MRGRREVDPDLQDQDQFLVAHDVCRASPLALSLWPWLNGTKKIQVPSSQGHRLKQNTHRNIRIFALQGVQG